MIEIKAQVTPEASEWLRETAKEHGIETDELLARLVGGAALKNRRIGARNMNDSKVYLVKVGESRTGKRRSYRAFAIRSQHIEDVTSELCRAMRVSWNNVTGTVDINGSYEWQDSIDIGTRAQLPVEKL